MHNTIAHDTATYNERFLRLLTTRGWIKNIHVILEDDTCRPCKVRPRGFHRGESPPLPVPRCTRRGGCACWYAVSPAG